MISGRLSHSVIALLLVICLSPVPASGRFAPISSSGANTILKLTALRAEYKENSLGIDAREPRLSWQIQANGRGVMLSLQRTTTPVRTTLLLASPRLGCERRGFGLERHGLLGNGLAERRRLAGELD